MNHIQTLLGVLRGENDRIDWSSAETDWQRFATLCEVHQVAPFVFCQLKNTGVRWFRRVYSSICVGASLRSLLETIISRKKRSRSPRFFENTSFL